MILGFERIMVVKVRKPLHHVLNEDLQWLGSSLGLFGPRDKNASCFRVFIELLKSAKLGKPLSSDDISASTGLSRSTVIHHLNRLISSGLVVIEGGYYILRINSLEELIREIKRDADRVFDDLQNIAKDVDEKLGLRGR